MNARHTMEARTSAHAAESITDTRSLLQLEVGCFECAVCETERWGGHVVLEVGDARAFCLECAKRLRIPAAIKATAGGAQPT
jgi:hypothetical protein